MLLSEHNVHYELQGLRTYFGWIITAIRNSNGNSLSVEPHGYIFAHNGIWSSNLEKMFHFTPWVGNSRRFIYIQKNNVPNIKKQTVSQNLCITIQEKNSFNTGYKAEIGNSCSKSRKNTFDDDDDVSEALVGRLSNPNLLQFGLSFSASAKIFLSNPKSNWKLLRGISPACGNKWGCKIVKTTQKP